MRSKQYLACLRAFEEGLVLETMYYPAEIRQFDVNLAKVTPTDTEIALARQLIESLAVPFEPEKYRDELREQVKEMIERKIAGETYKVTAAPEPGKVVDLMEALRASLAATEQEKGKPELKPEEAAEPEENEPSTFTPRKRRTKRAKGA